MMNFESAIITGVKSDHAKRKTKITFEVDMDEDPESADALAFYIGKDAAFSINLNPQQPGLFNTVPVGRLRADRRTGEVKGGG